MSVHGGKPSDALPTATAVVEGSSPLNSPESPETAILASADDVTRLYYVVMLRAPDALAMKSDPGCPLERVFYSKLNSVEFFERVVPIALGLRSAAPLAALDIAELRAWAAARLPVPNELRACLAGAASCEEIIRLLLQDGSVFARSPRLSEAGVDRLLRLHLVETERLRRTDHIRGEITLALGIELRGWCANRADTTERLIVEIFADNSFLGSTVCDQPVHALQERLGGDGRHGFRFVIPGAFLERFGKKRTVSVVERSTGMAIGTARLVDDRAGARSDAHRMLQEITEIRERLAAIEEQLPKIHREAGYPLDLYDEYAKDYSIVTDLEMATRSAAFPYRPVVSFILEIGRVGVDRLTASIESVCEQAYEHWELILLPLQNGVGKELGAYLRRLLRKEHRVRVFVSREEGSTAARLSAVRQCNGDWFGFIAAGDRLSKDAAFWFAAAAQRLDVSMIYSDEDACEVAAGGQLHRSEPRLKGAFDEDLLLATDYVGNLCLYRRSLFDAENFLDPQYEEIFDYDLRLCAVERLRQEQILHLCRVLYHRRGAASLAVDEELFDDRLQCLLASRATDHLRRTGRRATVEPHKDPLGEDRPFANRIRWSVIDNWPSLSILIPTRDRMDLLGPCLDSTLAAIAHYRGVAEIVVIDNESVEPASKEALAEWANRPQVRLVSYGGAFDWSAINNCGAEHAKGDVLLFLNNDTLVLSEDWCDELVTQAWREEVGAVGARLLYQDGTLQHAGIILGVDGVIHEGAGDAPQAGGYLGRTQLQRGAAAVTGACLATRRKVFEQISGFDPRLRVEFSDIDYCLRVRAMGLRVVYTPYATMYHYESRSRGLEALDTRRQRTSEERAVFFGRWGGAMGRDPYYNRHFDTRLPPFYWLNPAPNPIAEGS